MQKMEKIRKMENSETVYAFIWESVTENNCNTFLIDGPTRVLIDPGHLEHFGQVEKKLEDIGLKTNDIDLVICTHSHPDHMEAVQLFKNERVLFALHQNEWELVKSMDAYINAFGISLENIVPDFFLKEGRIAIKDIELEVFHTPGHSPGSICLYWQKEGILFTGDLFFKEGIGRTDLPGGSPEQIKKSIERLSGLIPDVKQVFPGHGNPISGPEEVKEIFSQIKRFWFGYL